MIDIKYTINHDVQNNNYDQDDCDKCVIYDAYDDDDINLKTFMVRFDTNEECGKSTTESEYNDEYYYDKTYGQSIGIIFSFIDYKNKEDVSKNKDVSKNNLDDSNDSK